MHSLKCQVISLSINVSANAGNLLNQGRIVSSGTVALQANLLNLGGQIAGRDLTNTTRDAIACDLQLPDRHHHRHATVGGR
ncbi:hypothetical protein CEK64_04790 [Xanthomonas sontii]|nr:hypothetical protein CEK64_04790 [Xanthomonas sontii]